MGPLFLVVDDDLLTARAIARVLRQFGRVAIATTMAQAEARLAEGGVDAITVDLQLPDGDGLDLLVGRRRTLHAVVLAALLEREDLLRAHAAGVPCWLKPKDVATLTRWGENVRDTVGTRHDRIGARVRIWKQRYRLSPAQAELLDGRARGMSRAEIARRRGVTLDTIEKHGHALLEKTGDSNVDAAAMRLLAESLADQDS